MSVQPLYRRGDTVDRAFIVSKGPVLVGLPGRDPHSIEANSIVVGTLEFLLADVHHTQRRLFDLYLGQAGEATGITLDVVAEMINQFHFGYNSNIFLGRLIEFTNHAFAESRRDLKDVLRPYQRRARLYVRMVDKLYDIGVRHQLRMLCDLAALRRDTALYRDGELYGRPSVFHAVVSPPSTRSRYVELYKKNSLICREGSRGKQMFVLLSGKIVVMAEGLYVATIETPGEAFGELSLFLDGKRTATLIAEEDTNVLTIEHKNIRHFVRHRCPTFFMSSAQALAERVYQNVTRIDRMYALANGPNP
ncbi:MAG: cyclic nucleotide-binding domain-containing protein, partial [Bdellovibrionales bacterium]|nr:cyclic nucleotide-binding domain-containing protein [Bdellovibrionales bacterium]